MMNEVCLEGKSPTVGNLERPDPDWSVEQLGQCAKFHDEQCLGLGRKMAAHRYREGHALTLARKKVPHGDWGTFLAKHGISKSSDDRARKLYEEAESEEELVGMTIMDAYVHYGIENRQKPNVCADDGQSNCGEPDTDEHPHNNAALPKPKAGGKSVAKLLKAGPEESLPDDLPGIEAACQEAQAERDEIQGRIKALTASDDDRIRHKVVLRRWLLLREKRRQIEARQQRQERLQAAERQHLEQMEMAEAKVARLYVLLKETCGLMQELYAAVCSVDLKVTERQEFVPLTRRFTELAEDLSFRIMPI